MAMRADDDQVGTGRVRHIEDALERRPLLDMNGRGGKACRLHRGIENGAALVGIGLADVVDTDCGTDQPISGAANVGACSVTVTSVNLAPSLLARSAACSTALAATSVPSVAAMILAYNLASRLTYG
jgi:hypothetical protein